MPVKILGICGSPVKGGNTEVFLSEALKAAEGLGDVSTESVRLIEKRIGDCRHCNWCLSKQEEGFFCCIKDDEPELLFLDEPTVGVDPELRASFWEYFDALKRAGVTIVLTTHYMDEAQHCDKIGLVRQGRLIAEGTPSEITRRTNTTNLEDAFLALARQQVQA